LTANGTPRSGASSPAPRRRSAASASAGAVGVDGAEGVELGVERRDPAQGHLDELARGHLAAPHEVGLRRDTGERDVHVQHPAPSLDG
jgi:hypothetical protein